MKFFLTLVILSNKKKSLAQKKPGDNRRELLARNDIISTLITSSAFC